VFEQHSAFGAASGEGGGGGSPSLDRRRSGKSHGGRGGRGYFVEREILCEDRAFELAQPCRRLQAEVLDHGLARALVRAQGIGLATRPVQRLHEEPPEVLAERVVFDGRLESRDRVARATREDLALEPALD